MLSPSVTRALRVDCRSDGFVEIAEAHVGPRRTLQLSLLLAAVIALALAMTGALSPGVARTSGIAPAAVAPAPLIP